MIKRLTSGARAGSTCALTIAIVLTAAYAVGEEKEIPYFAMEYVEGLSFAEILESLGRRSPSELSGADIVRALGLTTDDATVQAKFGGSCGESKPTIRWQIPWRRSWSRKPPTLSMATTSVRSGRGPTWSPKSGWSASWPH